MNTPQQSPPPFYSSTSLHPPLSLLLQLSQLQRNSTQWWRGAKETSKRTAKSLVNWLWQPQERKSIVSAQHCLNRSRSWWNDEEITQFHALHHLGQLHADTLYSLFSLSHTGTNIQSSVSSERTLWIKQPSSWLCECIINRSSCWTCSLLSDWYFIYSPEEVQ